MVPESLTDKTQTLLFGHDPALRIVACERVDGDGDTDEILFYTREAGGLHPYRAPFRPYLWVADKRLLAECDVPTETTELNGNAPLRYLVSTATSKALQATIAHLKKVTGRSPSAPDAPYFFLNDPVQQYLMQSGRTLFKGMTYDEVHRMQVDIETYSAPGYDFSNPDRDEDRIIAIAMADQSGWVEVLSGAEMDEKGLLNRFVALVRERDPDVIEGHNLFKFDLSYIATRAKRHRVSLKLGRDDSRMRISSGRFSAGERVIPYPKAEIFGRHIVDTFFMAQSYDVTHRSLAGFGLKEVAIHFGLAAEDRTYIEGSEIAREFEKNPGRVMDYARDDILETRALSEVLAPIYFAQAQLLPFSYQNVAVRGNSAKIDGLLLREYLRQKHSVPLPGERRDFEGGYTDIFFTGVAHNVHHCDVRSLYPSLMLSRGIAPDSDALGVFLALLDYLRTFRMEAKTALRNASDAERGHLDALQTAFKVLINSFYGYLGFGQARFNDFAAAARVAEEGRAILRHMIDWIRAHGGQPIEIDTDGIYFVPPDFKSEKEKLKFREALQESLPQGIEVEFDGEYPSMFSYKMKNYALLDEHGEVYLKGAALKSRGLEPFQRDFLREMVGLILNDCAGEISALKERYAKAILNGEWPVERLAKTETLQDAPTTYQEKIKGKSRGRNAAYELALRSNRKYKAGDQIAYYVTGTRKTVAVHEAAKPVSEWDAAQRDENVSYYLAKLDALASKFDDVLAEARPDTLSSQKELW